VGSFFCEISVDQHNEEAVDMVENFKSVWKRLKTEEEGASLVEYVMLVALIGISAVVGMGFIDNKSRNALSMAGNAIP
jgi:Flp pilus assembly pilin Flp